MIVRTELCQNYGKGKFISKEMELPDWINSIEDYEKWKNEVVSLAEWTDSLETMEDSEWQKETVSIASDSTPFERHALKEDSKEPLPPQQPRKWSIRNVVFGVIFGISLILAGISLYVYTQNFNAPTFKFDPDTQAFKTSTISGGAWVIRAGGQSDLLRGFEIVLCKTGVDLELKKAINDREKETNGNKNKSVGRVRLPEGYHRLDISKMRQTIAPYIIRTASTSIEGKYSLTDIPEGSYFLFAGYKSEFSVAYWLIPVSVDNGKDVHIDLYNMNMEEMYNKNER